MRLALLSSDWRPTGGVATYARHLASALAAAGHEVRVLHGDGADVAGIAGVEAVAFPGAFLSSAANDAAAGASLAQAVEAFAPDVVHVVGNNNFSVEESLRDRGRPFVKTLHVHDYCPSGTKYHFALGRPCIVPTSALCVPRMGYLRCTLSRRPDVIWSFYRRTTAANRHHQTLPLVIVCSEYLKRQAVASGFAPEHLEALPYFTSLPNDAPPSTSREVLFVGRLVRAKGVDVLLQALARLTGHWTAVIAGDGPERAPLERQAAALGLSDRVSFRGWTTGDALARVYAHAAVVVVPSLWPEPFGIVGLEAMAHSRTVVASNVGGIPEWLEEGIGGTLAPAGDVAALAGKIAWLLDHPAEAAGMAARGRERVSREFTASSHLAKLVPMYERVRAARV